ncbi:MAG: zinc ribbon domain-containing protein [Thermoplasmata archaeon]|nr:zinc ribbon domain-containing protein [Thermoplasmata archaeon]
MPRAIVAAALHRPSYRVGELSAQGPDEDAFTLAVTATERLMAAENGPLEPIDGLHVVGDFPAEADAGLPEALGIHHVAVVRHGGGLAGLGAALHAAARPEGPGRSLVLVAEVPPPSAPDLPLFGAGAIAFELCSGAPGLAPVGHGSRRHPTHRPPDADGWVADATRHGGLPSVGAHGALYFIAKESPPVLLRFWQRAQPGLPILPGPIGPTGIGPAPSMAPALWVADLAGRPEAGEWGLIARVTAEASEFLGLHRTGTVRLIGLPLPLHDGPGLGAPSTALPVDVVGAVSEGAYVPRPRYIENLPSRWRLIGDRCANCGALTFPSRGRCRTCGASEALEPELLPRRGTVLAATAVSPGAHPTEFDALVAASGAYGVALVELAPGVRATLQVADHDASPLAAGSPVTTELRRLYPMEGEWRYGRKALAARGSA